MTQSKQLIFSTGNESKFLAADKICSKYGVKVIQNSLEIDEIQSEDAEKIVIDKVDKAYDLIKQPVIVSDDSWAIPGLGGFPGPYMKSMNHWFKPQDFINITQHLKDRRIFLDCYLAYKDSTQTKIFHRRREGAILTEPKGKSEFANHLVVSMSEDNGLTIAEIYERGLYGENRDVEKVWHDFIDWFID